jgi:hypothetical protein
MIKTSTPELELTPNELHQNQSQQASQEASEPSWTVLQNILNFSKNLEVKQSTLLGAVDFIRS